MSARTNGKASSVRRAMTLAVVSSLGVFGCSQIIGLGDYTVGSSAGGAGASEAGAPAEGGANSAAGEAGAGGTPGSGVIVGCDGTTPFQPTESVVRSCILRAGCDPSFNPVRPISTCVTYNTQAALPGEQCNLPSQTCADFEACEHVGVAHDDLCGGSKGTRCENGLAINCGNYQGGDRFFDCNALGNGCSLLTYTNGTIYADCTIDIAPSTCEGQPDDDGSFYCHSASGQDDSRYYCWGEKAFGNSCSSLGKCIDDQETNGGGQGSCFFNLQHCTTPVSPTCNNNVVNDCSAGDLFKYDCTSAGLECNTTSSGSEYCLAPGCNGEDVDSKCTEHCSDDGTQLTFCYGGAPVTVNCADYGFTQCLSDTNDSGAFAACRF